MKEWDGEKNKLDPKTLSLYSGKKAWWLCEETCTKGHVHSWEAIIHNRVNGNGCPFCSNPPHQVCPCNSLKAQYGDLVKNSWDFNKNKGLDPETLCPFSHKKVSWVCNKCSTQWEAKIKKRTAQGTGCPRCAPSSKGEEALHQIFSEIKEKFPSTTFHPQQSYPDLVSDKKRCLRYDFKVTLPGVTQDILFEYDGIQHFDAAQGFYREHGFIL